MSEIVETFSCPFPMDLRHRIDLEVVPVELPGILPNPCSALG